jgi:uncharacterized protein with ParB-like and HNH nuclease domain
VDRVPKLSLQPTAKTVEEVLKGPAYYKIPRFQRPYSWESEHIDDFWVDAVANLDGGYFIGPMVVYRDNERDYGIVDGQQRLTTITLILAAIRDNFEALGDEDLASGTHEFIERRDRDHKERFVLQSDVDEGSWIQAVQLRKSKASDHLSRTDLEDQAWAAFSVISKRLEEALAEVMNQDSAAKSTGRAIDKLKELRDQVLGLNVIWVPLESEDDAYEIFETLNSRGKDLEVADRLKNYFLGNLRALNANVDEYRRRWNIIRERFANEPTSRDINRFILHWWLSHQPYVAERKLFKQVKRNVNRSAIKKTFDSFEVDSRLYARIIAPNETVWTIERHQLRDTLSALQLMRLAQPMPFVLSIMRALDLKQISLKDVRETLAAIENYHYQATAISTRSSSGGVSEMYASHARHLANARTKPARRQQLIDLVQKLKERAPVEDEFVDAFNSRLVFAEEYTRDKRLVQYTLAKLHSYSNPTPPADFTKFTIEHVAPQSLIKTKADLAVYGSIGNLLYVDDPLNSRLSDKDFSAKKPILRRAKDNYDLADVIGADRWSETEIEERGKRLARLAYTKVWPLVEANRGR